MRKGLCSPQKPTQSCPPASKFPARLYPCAGGFSRQAAESRSCRDGEGGGSRALCSGGVPARQLQAGHLPQDPTCRIGAGQASTRFKKGTKLILPAAKRDSAERACARCLRSRAPTPGAGDEHPKGAATKKGSGDESSTQGCHCVLPTVPCWDGSRGSGPPKGAATGHPPCNFGHLQRRRWSRRGQSDAKPLLLLVLGCLGGFFFFFGRWILRCSSASCFLPNTQGPRRAFKIPFITMEPPRLRAQAEGPGGGFWGWVLVVVFFFVVFFALNFL